MNTPFIEDDLTMLQRSYRVDAFIGSGFGAVFAVLRRASAADISISWFASVYSFFMVAAARLRNRPSIILLGGVDTARDDSIGYGIWRSAWRRPLLRFALRHASRIIAVDASLARALEASSGLTNLDVEVIPTGYDSSFWTADAQRSREILLVASCRTMDRFLVKGIDIYIDAARRIPGESFVLVGVDSALVAASDPPSNLRAVPAVDRTVLREHYRRASIYCQPSRHEGLPNSLCEAMLCGCIPVGARVGGMADVIGECGFVFEPGDTSALVEALNAALASASSDDGAHGFNRRECARARIIERYPNDLRASQLMDAIDGLLHA